MLNGLINISLIHTETGVKQYNRWQNNMVERKYKLTFGKHNRCKHNTN